MESIKKNTEEILNLYGSKYDEKGKFYHLLEEIGKHTIKLARLKENEDRPGHFKEEVADIYLLAYALMELEGIEGDTVKNSSDNFLSVIKRIYGS